MTQSFFQSFILLLLVTDPFGNVPLFVAAMAKVPPERRWRVVVRECAIAFLLLLLFMFFGRHFLSALQLSEVALRIGGGVILFLIALRMVFPQPGGLMGDVESTQEPFIVPLAIPALAGPSALATVLLFSSGTRAKCWCMWPLWRWWRWFRCWCCWAPSACSTCSARAWCRRSSV